jgi:hypothetical protein
MGVISGVFLRAVPMAGSVFMTLFGAHITLFGSPPPPIKLR